MRFSAVGIVAAATLSCAAAQPASNCLSVEADLLDGSEVLGVVQALMIPLRIQTPDGETAEIALRKPQEWSSLKTAAEIDRLEDRGTYRIRAATFTAEAAKIEPALSLTSSEQKIRLEWSEIRNVRISASGECETK